jgi:hypothetical protein
MILDLQQVFLNELLGGDDSRLLDTDLCTGKSCISHRQTVLSSQFVFACYIAKYLIGMLFSVDLFSMLHVPWRFACIGLEDTSVTPITQGISNGLVDGRQSVLRAFCMRVSVIFSKSSVTLRFSFCLPLFRSDSATRRDIAAGRSATR